MTPAQEAQQIREAARVVAESFGFVVIDPETDADRLWNIIRTVDGNHDLGAGALAEAILRELVRRGGEAS